MDFFAVLPRPRIDLTAPEKATLLGLSFVTLTGNLIPTRTGSLRSHDRTLTQDDLACVSADTMPVGRLFHQSTIPGMSYQLQPTADTFDESETPALDQIAHYLKLPETWTVVPETNEGEDGPTLGPLILRTPKIRKTVFTDPDGDEYKHLKAQEWDSALSAWHTMAGLSLEEVSKSLDLWKTHHVTSGIWSTELDSLNLVLAVP